MTCLYKFELEHDMLHIFVRREGVRKCGKFKSDNKLGSQIADPLITSLLSTKEIGSAKTESVKCKICGRSANPIIFGIAICGTYLLTTHLWCEHRPTVYNGDLCEQSSLTSQPKNITNTLLFQYVVDTYHFCGHINSLICTGGTQSIITLLIT